MAEMDASVGGPSARQGTTRALRDKLIEEAEGNLVCWRCGQTTSNPANMHAGHRNKARSEGGNLSETNLCLEGAACNLSAQNRGAPSAGMSCAERGGCGTPYGRED